MVEKVHVKMRRTHLFIRILS